jgi:hypothetical protein
MKIEIKVNKTIDTKYEIDMSSNDLFKESLDRATAEIAKDIDNGILADLYKQDGWDECVIDPWKHGSQSTVEMWCEQAAGEFAWFQAGNRFLFKDPRVATMFRIKWS